MNIVYLCYTLTIHKNEILKSKCLYILINKIIHLKVEKADLTLLVCNNRDEDTPMYIKIQHGSCLIKCTQCRHCDHYKTVFYS